MMKDDSHSTELSAFADLEQELLDRRQKEFALWCEEIESIPEDYEKVLMDRFVADVEPQPLRWLTKACGLLGPPKSAISTPSTEEPLPYPVFLTASELFLKGMWLCQFEDCRHLRYNDYIAEKRRADINKSLKKLGHDLLKIIEAVAAIKTYSQDPTAAVFLKRLRGLTRGYFFPLYRPASNSWAWSASRYPMRVYNDLEKQAQASSYVELPQRWMIAQLFDQMHRHVDKLWEIRRGFAKSKSLV